MDRPNLTVEIRSSPIKGRALHTTIPLSPGQTILTVPPLLLIPSTPHLQTHCTHCLRRGKPRTCTRCHSAQYCNATCQRLAWRSVHAKECAALKRVREQGKGDLPTPVRLLVQTLLNGVIEKAVEGLEGHAGGEKGDDTQMMVVGACAYAGLGTGEDAIRRASDLMCKIQTNAFNYSDDDLGLLGVFLEPTLAMINHSCLPNAIVQLIGGNVILRAETAVKAGDEIEISYTDYTWPLAKRSLALEPYKFKCQCMRCLKDLSVYQASALSSNINLNIYSLAVEVANIKQHLAVTNSSFVEKITKDIDSSETQNSSMRAMWAQYGDCKELLARDLWALAPLPGLLTTISAHYSDNEEFANALTTACLLATECDPYRHVTPFHPSRVERLYLIAKLLANTAAETAVLTNSANSMAVKPNIDSRVQDILREIDQVSLCQMVLIMILRLTAAGLGNQWETAILAKQMLDDIKQLRGREKELSLINAWVENSESEQSKAFFKYAVVDPVHDLARLGKAVLKANFETFQGNPLQ